MAEPRVYRHIVKYSGCSLLIAFAPNSDWGNGKVIANGFNLFSAVNVIVGIPYYQYLALSPVSCLSNNQGLMLKGSF